MGKANDKVDSWIEKVLKYVNEKISFFVAFLFFIYTSGAFTALIVIQRWPEQAYLVVVLPLVAGVLAYYNRALAAALFGIFIIFFFII
jgi:hypothetical protein